MSENQPERAAEREHDDERCRHGNRIPCPMCLADKYDVPVWNNV